MRRLNTVFSLTPALKALTHRVAELQNLQSIWLDCAPAPLNQHSHVGLLKHGQLTILTSSSAVAAKLKLQPNALTKKLQARGVEVTSIRFEVQVESHKPYRTILAKRPNAKTLNHLQRFAESLPDSPLQAALRRLTRHQSQR